MIVMEGKFSKYDGMNNGMGHAQSYHMYELMNC